MSDQRQAMGLAGEKLAEKLLRKNGLRIVARRFAVPGGEIDLVARRRDTLVFVEVKCRRDSNWTEPEQAVNLGKQRRMTRAAKAFVRGKRLEHMPCRFDIVAVVLPENGKPAMTHFEDAFAPESW